MAAMVGVMKVLFSGDIIEPIQTMPIPYCFLNMNLNCPGLRGVSFKEVLQDD